MNQKTCPHCGAEVSTHGSCDRCLMLVGLETGGPTGDEARLGKDAIDGYEIQEILGAGGMGVVYKARQTRLGRTVAIKVLSSAVRDLPGFADRFQREARAMANLSHQNIVAVHDFGVTNGHYYLVMEFVDGANLRQILKTGPISPDLAQSIAWQIAEALHYAHGEGIVHRDIKPENVFVDTKGRVKIGDFGLARIIGQDETSARLTASRHVLGTPHYMAPEQVTSPLGADHRADIFSVGVVLYELLTGRLPIGRFEAPSHFASIPPALDALVLRALEHRPENRFQRISELADALGKALPGASRVEERSVPGPSAGERGAPPPIVGEALALRPDVRAAWAFFHRFWESAFSLLGIVGCCLPWIAILGSGESVCGIETFGGILALTGFVVPAAASFFAPAQAARVLRALNGLLGGALAIVGVLFESTRHFGETTGLYLALAAGLGLLAFGVILTATTLFPAISRTLRRRSMPAKLHGRLRLAVILVGFLAIPILSGEWRTGRRPSILPGALEDYAISGSETAEGTVAGTTILVLVVLMLITAQLQTRRLDGLFTVVAAVVVVAASASGHHLVGSVVGPYLALIAGSVLGLLGVTMLLCGFVATRPE